MKVFKPFPQKISMYWEFVLVEIGVASFAGIILLFLLKKFSFKKPLIGVVMFPLFMFTLGFALRLSGATELIDRGYYFTDFSFLFIYLVFALQL